MTMTTFFNDLVPDGYFVQFVPADCESVDDAFAIHGNDGDTGVSFQMGDGYICVSYFHDAENDADAYCIQWGVHDFTQAAALREDAAKALGKAAEAAAAA